MGVGVDVGVGVGERLGLGAYMYVCAYVCVCVCIIVQNGSRRNRAFTAVLLTNPICWSRSRNMNTLPVATNGIIHNAIIKVGPADVAHTTPGSLDQLHAAINEMSKRLHLCSGSRK